MRTTTARSLSVLAGRARLVAWSTVAALIVVAAGFDLARDAVGPDADEAAGVTVASTTTTTTGDGAPLAALRSARSVDEAADGTTTTSRAATGSTTTSAGDADTSASDGITTTTTTTTTAATTATIAGTDGSTAPVTTTARVASEAPAVATTTTAAATSTTVTTTTAVAPTTSSTTTTPAPATTVTTTTAVTTTTEAVEIVSPGSLVVTRDSTDRNTRYLDVQVAEATGAAGTLRFSEGFEVLSVSNLSCGGSRCTTVGATSQVWVSVAVGRGRVTVQLLDAAGTVVGSYTASGNG